MGNESIVAFIVVSLMFVLAALYEVVVSFKSKLFELNRLASGTIFGIFAVVFYTCRLFAECKNVFLVWTSLCLISIVGAMYFFTQFSVHFTRMARVGVIRKLMLCFSVAALFDVVIWLVNPFTCWALNAEHVSGILHFHYVNKEFLYFYHIALIFVMFMVSMALMIIRYVREPKVYRKRYIGSNAVVALLLLLNILLDEFTDVELDYSIEFYCLLPVCVYWYSCRYAVMDLVNYFRNTVFKNIDQGIVLFDYKGSLIMHNAMAEQLLSGIRLDSSLSQRNFMKLCNISYEHSDVAEVYSTQCYVNHNEKIQTMRCDFHKIKGEKDRTIGNLFVLSDTVMKTDLLTGFHSWESFKAYIDNDTSAFTYPLTVIVCDLNNLSRLNSLKGHNAGDNELSRMADALRSAFPQGSYFVRGEDAKMIVLCDYMELAEVNERMTLVKKTDKLNFQYAVDGATTWQPDVLMAIDSATHTLMQKKLLDRNSAHSELLTSLVRALQECDSDTEAHVKRTQHMGAALGRRIGLSDKQQSNLSLLCLLHDIGKIGIPLDILNKPGKLTNDEWNTIKTHVQKGYEIAKSSKGLVEIADMILHHHERWDGRGYPDGLKGENIPLLSRIIAVVDAFDAMVNNRSYRAARPVEDAIAELEHCSGTQFDPYLVTEFVAICRGMVKDVVPDEDKVKNPYDDVIERSKKADSSSNRALHHVHSVMFSRYILDRNSAIIEVDENFELLTGFSMEDVQKMSLNQSDLIPEEDLTEYLCLVSEELANKPMVYFEHRLKRKDGTIIYVFCIGKVVYDSVNRENRSEIIVTNSSNTYAMMMMKGEAKDRAVARLKHFEDSSRIDPLTGLLNAESFKSEFEKKLQGGESKVLVLMLDVDHFKKYKSKNGENSSNEFLVMVAHAINDSLRDLDLACRLTDDAFAAMLFFDKNVAAEFMYNRAQEIYDKISMTISSVENAPTISMGAVIDSELQKTYEVLFEAVKKNLKQSKKNGGACLSVPG